MNAFSVLNVWGLITLILSWLQASGTDILEENLIALLSNIGSPCP